MHQIQQHIFKIDCSSQPFGKEVQSVVADLMEKEFYPKLEILLDKYKLDNATWILDKIDINLSSISNENWKNELVEKSLQEIENYLNENYKVLSTKYKQYNESSNTIMLDTQYAEFLFFEYLKTGLLKQDSIYKTILEIENQLVEQTFSSIKKTKNFCNELIKLMYENPKSLMRFIFTISNQTKTLLKKEGVGFLFEIEPFFKNNKSVSLFFSSPQEYTNWISLLEWSLYFFWSNNYSKNVIDQFKTSSLANFQLNENKVISLLDYLFNSFDKKITKNHLDLLIAFKQKINTSSKEIDFNTNANSSYKNEVEQTISNEEEILVPKTTSEITNDFKIDSDFNGEEKNQNEEIQAEKNQDKIKTKPDLKGNKIAENKNFEKNNLSDFQNSEISNSDSSNKSSKNKAENKLEDSTVDKKPKTAIDNLTKEDKIDSESKYRRFNLEGNDSENVLVEPSNSQKNNELNLEEPIYIENSGLVILHPFLIHLFEQLKLCKNEEWTSKKNQSKALLLSQFLITGKTVFFENDLVLNKLLCGFQVDSVIDITIKLSKKEITEANDLLKAVIAYWKVLKNTSIDGLRETFLQRNGKLLFKNEESIELWVEQKGVDVLMAQIPWGIGMIKTPWMKNFIECNWN